MNSSQRRMVMFGEKAVIEMDIDPFVSNLDTPGDLKVPPTYNIPKPASRNVSPTPKNKKTIGKKARQDEEKKENDASEVEEPAAKKKC